MVPAIRVDNLGKCYRVAHNQQRGGYRTLRDTIVDAVKAPFRRLRNAGQAEAAEDFWALKDVSFEVQPGEVVGIIGRNGAGKSTLLKLLSRITKPTKGRIELNGRVGSLLEVGTGFHPELTGRENVYLNGSILGMKREEIARKFDEIVAFAEIEKFLDTPVKRYSSGMYVRLAFAVAAYLDPEILVVDEVLAVGDAQFQQKCLERIEQIAQNGRTVFFVSHQINVVQRFCQTALLLDRGRIECYGDKNTVIPKYLSKTDHKLVSGQWHTLENTRDDKPCLRFAAVRFSGRSESLPGHIVPDCQVDIDIAVEVTDPTRSARVAVSLYDQYGTKLINMDSLALAQPLDMRQGSNELCFTIESLHLKPGKYVVGLWSADSSRILHHIPDAAVLEVADYSNRSGTIGLQGDGMITSPFKIRQIVN